MVTEIAGVSRLVLQIDLPIALDEGRQLRRNRPSQIAELVALDQAVQRDGGGWPRARGLSPGSPSPRTQPAMAAVAVIAAGSPPASRQAACISAIAPLA